MRIRTVGDDGNPVIVMLTGSFCQSKSLGMFVRKTEKKDYYIILLEYNGHYAHSTLGE